MAEYEKYLNEHIYPGAMVYLAQEILKLRSMLWLNHGHKGMYGDDGEMQCSECMSEYGFYDWKRTSIGEIEAKINVAALKKLSDQVEFKDGEPCTHGSCMHHEKHPCEVCGRVRARGVVKISRDKLFPHP